MPLGEYRYFLRGIFLIKFYLMMVFVSKRDISRFYSAVKNDRNCVMYDLDLC